MCEEITYFQMDWIDDGYENTGKLRVKKKKKNSFIFRGSIGMKILRDSLIEKFGAFFFLLLFVRLFVRFDENVGIYT